MADRRVARLVVRQRNVAIRAADHLAAGRALDVRRIAAAVQQQDHLPVVLQGRLHGVVQQPADAAAAADALALGAEVDRAHFGQRAVQHPPRHLDQLVLALGGPLPAFQRRRGRAEHQRHAFRTRAGSGHVAGVVARGRLLLEGRLVFFVQHDQAQVRRGGEDRAAGADHDVDLPGGDLLPVPMPLGVAEVAVEHGHRPEPPPETLDRLRREADLRHQHDRLAAVAHDLLDRLDVDLRLAAARDAVDQERAMLLATAAPRGPRPMPVAGPD